jgi:D-lactate dehydrogenase
MTDLRLFSAKPYDRRSFEAANADRASLTFLESRLEPSTAGLAAGADAVCAFVNDDLSEPVLRALAEGGTRCVALRCAGYNHVDLAAAEELGLVVAHVPAYSPNAVAEHTIALILASSASTSPARRRV